MLYTSQSGIHILYALKLTAQCIKNATNYDELNEKVIKSYYNLFDVYSYTVVTVQLYYAI
jgi:hypothetical protein